jgi:hypothetical protein
MTASTTAGTLETVTTPRRAPVRGQDADSRHYPHVGTLELGG